MKVPVSISVVSSLFLVVFAVSGTASGETNDLARAKAALSDPRLSQSSSQILQLTQAGMDESVITSFIRSSARFQLSADQIVYLNDLGVSSRVIQAMLAHDREKLAASSQNTNTPNITVVVQQDTATTSMEQPTFQNPAQTVIQADTTSIQAAVVPMVLSKIEKLSKADLAGDDPRITSPQAVPQKKKVFYPVRAPYSVELTAPIVFLDAPTF